MEEASNSQKCRVIFPLCGLWWRRISISGHAPFVSGDVNEYVPV